MRVTLVLAAAAMMALAAPAFAQQPLQPGSPGIGPGGQQPYTGGPSDNGPGPAMNAPAPRMNEGRAAAPDDSTVRGSGQTAPISRDNVQ